MGDSLVQTRKQELRRRLRSLRLAMGDEKRSMADTAIAKRVQQLPAFAKTGVLLTYLSVREEVNTRSLVQAAWEQGKTVALPWCVPHSRDMRWYRVRSFDSLVQGPHGIWEPDPHACDEQMLDTGEQMLALVPALAFDAQGYRLGYGGGFYDTFLASFEGVSVGLCREEQMRESLRDDGVFDTHDLPVHIVVTQSRTIVM